MSLRVWWFRHFHDCSKESTTRQKQVNNLDGYANDLSIYGTSGSYHVHITRCSVCLKVLSCKRYDTYGSTVMNVETAKDWWNKPKIQNLHLGRLSGIREISL